MAESPQNYHNHVRMHPLFHYFVGPVMLLNAIWALVRFFRAPGWNDGESALVSLALVAMVFLVRTYPLKVQDRLIRLEEQLRYERLLPTALARRAAALAPRQVIALRFAADAELPELVRQALEGRFSKPDEIKRAIQSWRADTFRV